jgi:hypothetical protein
VQKGDYIKVVIWNDIFMKLVIYRRDGQNESSKVVAEFRPKIYPV